MIEAGVPSTGGWVVPSPPGAVMVAPLEVSRNAERAQGEGRAREGSTKRGQGHYKGRSPKAPAPRCGSATLPDPLAAHPSSVHVR
jgi:hypothetical protein